MLTWIVMDETIIPEVEDSEGRKSKKWNLFMLRLDTFCIIVYSINEVNEVLVFFLENDLVVILNIRVSEGQKP